MGQQSGGVSDIEVLSTVRRREMAGQPEMPKASKASLVRLTLPAPSQVHWRLLPTETRAEASLSSDLMRLLGG